MERGKGGERREEEKRGERQTGGEGEGEAKGKRRELRTEVCGGEEDEVTWGR